MERYNYTLEMDAACYFDTDGGAKGKRASDDANGPLRLSTGEVDLHRSCCLLTHSQHCFSQSTSQVQLADTE